jgi:hypothetical protein
MPDIKIKPCPFCGAEAVINEFKKRIAVNCLGDDCFAQQKGPKELQDRIIEMWNRRTSNPK